MPLKRASGKRTPKLPPKLKDNGFPLESPNCDKWCTILSAEDNKKHVVHCKHLETELGDNVSENDIKNGSELVWRHRGIPYTIQVLGVHDKKPTKICEIGETRVRQREDSDSTDEDAHEKLQCSKKTKSHVAITDVAITDVAITDVAIKSPKQIEKRKVLSKNSYKCLSSSGETSGINTEIEGKVLSKKSKSVSSKSSSGETLSLHTEESRISKVDSSDDEAGLFRPHTKKSNLIPRKEHRKDPAETQFREVCKRLDKFEKAIFSLNEKCDLLLSKVASPKQIITAATNIKTEQKAKCISIQHELSDEQKAKYISESGVNLLAIRAPTPEKYALSLMDALFDDEVMSGCCFMSSMRSVKPPLPEGKTNLIQECIDIRFGLGTFTKESSNIIRRCNQKCLDSLRRLKKLDNN